MEAQRNEAEREEPSTAFTDLPNQVMTEILCRLPIKTVVAFKCFCKSMLDLVSTDTHLAESHRRRSATTELLLRPAADTDLTSTKLYLGNLRFQNQLVIEVKPTLLLDLPAFDWRNDNSIIWGKTERNRIEFANSCNGLLCFRSSVVHSSSFYGVIINPVTGEFITVPMSTKRRKRNGTVDYALGFSVKENRFKLLQVTGTYGQCIAEICTFEKGSSSWRDVGYCPYPFSGSGSVFLEGKIHFNFHFRGFYGSGNDIAYFDFENEQFGVVPIPSRNHDTEYEYRFGVLKGCLFINRYGACGYETWVMKEYGVESSWTKVFCVQYDLVTYRYPPVPIEELENGEILMLCGRKCLHSYNPGANSTETISHGAIKLLGVSAYSPTLLRLKDALAGHEACVHNVNSSRRNLTQSHQEGQELNKEPKKRRLKSE